MLIGIQIINERTSCMEATLKSLLEHKEQLYQRLASLGEFRRGSISVNYRKCGKSNCGCAQPGHPGHGPQYLWNATIGGKSQARNLCLGPELEKVGEEVENYRHFQQWSQAWVEVNEQICERRPVGAVAEESELEQLKKKLQRKYSRKRNKR
jgi:hypothetical protein